MFKKVTPESCGIESGVVEKYLRYLEKREGLDSQEIKEVKEEAPLSRGNLDYQRSKERAKKERRLAKVRELISQLEEKIELKTMEQGMEENQSDYEKLCKISEELLELENQLLALYEECEELENTLR